MEKCLICSKELKRKSALISHLQTHKISYMDYKIKFDIKDPIKEILYCKICNSEIKSSHAKIYCSNKCKFADKELNSKRVHKVKNDKTKFLECTICHKSVYDILNLGGHATRHLREAHNIHDDNYDKYYILKDVPISTKKKFHCPLCDWTSNDLNNSSGWFTNHLKKEHKLSIHEFLVDYPDYEHLWTHYIVKQNRRNLFEDKDNYITCKICNKKFKYLTNSHLKLHNITQKKYKKKYGEIMSKRTLDILAKNYESSLALHGHTYVSKGELEVVDFIKSLGVNNVEQSNRSIIAPLELDIYLPDFDIAIEYNGLYFHSELNGKSKTYHLDKTNLCEAKGIQLIHIFSDEWANKKDLVKNKIQNLLKLNNNKSIFARKCTIEIITTSNKKKFLNSYHIQGAGKSKIKLGLFYLNELVACMTFGELRAALGSKTHVNHFELIRFASKYNIPGGASKLLNYFVINYKPEKIISYADRRWTKSINNVYEKIGFTKVTDGSPNYWYMETYSKRLHRYNFTKHHIVNKLNGDPNLSEWANMQSNGYDRIWDCGNLKYEKIY